MIFIKIIAHRASGSIYKQNTKEAILDVLNKPYIDGVEFDVRITFDKKIVIIHDPVINFVSDGIGIVKNMYYKELLKYNFGSKNYPSRIALLDEVLKNVNNKIIVIEIKEETDDYKEIADIIYNIIKKYKLNIYIASFNYELIKYFKTKYHKCGLIIGYCFNTDKLHNHFDFNIVSYRYKDRVDKKETFIWTINEYKNDLEDYFVITDKPYLIHSKYQNTYNKQGE